jgi:SpoVK/Ycf46/Vps4 family AAA+-type ATPase
MPKTRPEPPGNLQAPFDGLAQRLPTAATWGDLVLAQPVLAQLRQIAAEASARFRGFTPTGRTGSITALFSGQRGTGKTLAARVLANALQLDLRRIDLAALHSKYIGETERNLRRLFDAAEAGGAILFFDETDALFGQRTEVKDSRDRYTNLDVTYLLRRVEEFAGLAILSTNLKQALDPAFVRRLRYVVDFPLPGQQERRQIWQRVLPVDAATRDLDYDRLARPELPGGSIHSIAVEAALRAAAAGTPVTMSLILEAAGTEFLKRLRPTADVDR